MDIKYNNFSAYIKTLDDVTQIKIKNALQRLERDVLNYREKHVLDKISCQTAVVIHKAAYIAFMGGE